MNENYNIDPKTAIHYVILDKQAPFFNCVLTTIGFLYLVFFFIGLIFKFFVPHKQKRLEVQGIDKDALKKLENLSLPEKIKILFLQRDKSVADTRCDDGGKAIVKDVKTQTDDNRPTDATTATGDAADNNDAPADAADNNDAPDIVDSDSRNN